MSPLQAVLSKLEPMRALEHTKTVELGQDWWERGRRKGKLCGGRGEEVTRQARPTNLPEDSEA